MKHVYLAAPFDKADRVLEVVDDLEATGITVAASWATRPFKETQLSQAAELNFDDMCDAQTLVALTMWGPSTAGGMWSELGFMIGICRPCLVLEAPGEYSTNPFVAAASRRVLRAPVNVSDPGSIAVRVRDFLRVTHLMDMSAWPRLSR